MEKEERAMIGEATGALVRAAAEILGAVLKIWVATK